jgi:hypothetical protein
MPYPRTIIQRGITICKEEQERMPLEKISYEPSPSHATPREAYEQNHTELLELMGRINGRLAAKYRTDLPRGWDHIGEQEEMIAMLQCVTDFLGA